MPTVSYWNGSSWTAVNKTHFSYWSGSSWTAPTDIKYYDGSAWQTLFPATGIALRSSGWAWANMVSSIGITIPSSTQVGDLLVLIVAQTNLAATVFNAISGWTKQGEERAGSAAFTLGIFTRLAQSGDAGSTVTSTSTTTENMSIEIRVYSGVNQTTPLDTSVVFAQAATASTTASAPAISVVTTGAMLVAVYGVPTTANTTLGDAQWTGPSGFGNELTACSTDTGNNAAIASYDKLSPGTGSQGPFSATITQSRRWAMATMALRPA